MVVATGILSERLAALIDTSLATAVAIDCIFSLALGVVLVRTLTRGERARRAVMASPESDKVPPRSLALLVVVVASWAMLIASVVCLLVGYVALGGLLVKQTAWVAIVASSTYLLAAFVDDAAIAWVGAGADADDKADKDAPPVPPLRRQAAVLLSGVARVVLIVIAIALMLGPLGQAPDELLQRAEGLREGFAVGEIRILPAAVVQSLLTLVLGIAAVRALQRWLLARYLPTTSLDAGMGTSTATLLGYTGYVIVVALALSALGLGLERVAWVASALSVGIGFGLQAVVQNFVSGLILLTERPVAVGDWVSLSGVEGDIRRINVRATEIQTGDRSTVIVPNSEFITKIVRNVTHASPLGLVSIRLPMPLDTDVLRVRDLLLDALAAHEGVLESPQPNVQLDAVERNAIVFVATGSVSSPRQTGSVKSALLFDILARFRAEGLALVPQAASVTTDAAELDARPA